MPSTTTWIALLCALSAASARPQDPVTVTETVTATITSVSTVGESCSAPATTSAAATTTVNTQEYPTSTETSTETGTQGLDDLAKATGKAYFGTAADIPGPEQQDNAYMMQLNNTRDFGQLTPANYMKYVYTEPSQGVFNYTGGDVIVDIAAANGQVVRCHNLVWYNQLPDWLMNGNWTNATLIAVLENHITNLVQHWGESCYQWDVVNEAFNDNGTYRSDIWYDTIGPAYIPIAFAAAAKAAPDSVKLYYNDYNIENPGNKSTAAQNLVKELQAQGIRIDGVGLQSHFIVGQTPSQEAQEENMAAFAALGVDVAITELDVRVDGLPASVETQEQQKKDYYTTVAACVNTPRCVGMTLWDFVDQYSWIPSTFPGQGYADLWFEANGTDTLVRKVAYDGVVEALTGQAES